VLGSASFAEEDTFHGYLITAKKLDGDQLGTFLGHFEPQWDAIGHCCGNAQRPVSIPANGFAFPLDLGQTL